MSHASSRPAAPPKQAIALTIALAFSVGLNTLQPAQAAPGDVNSVNVGEQIQGGTYFNTQGSRTTFTNPGGPLHLKSGLTVRGLESDIAGSPTGNGGVLNFRAPNNIIRLDGNVDVSALGSGGAFQGAGGKVFVDAAYLYQNGHIFANGTTGGLVQFNVGAATIAPTARIEARGSGGPGGSVSISSPGTVDIQRGAVVDTRGLVVGTFDTNVISIEGGLVNTDGVLAADGAASRGGTVRLVAAGQFASSADVVAAAGESVLSAGEKQALGNRMQALFAAQNGDVVNRGTVSANGTTDHPGGSILVAAADDVANLGTLRANGAGGGTVAIAAMDAIFQEGVIEANGSTGHGGLVAFSYNSMNHAGQTRANGGGHGGLVVFSSNANPQGAGSVSANGSGSGLSAGTVVTPAPGTFALAFSTRDGSGRSRPLRTTQRNELLLHQENLLLLTRAGGVGRATASLDGRLASAISRTVLSPEGAGLNARDALVTAANFFVGSQESRALNLDLGTSLPLNPLLLRSNTITVVTRGSLNNSDTWTPGVHVVGNESFHDIQMAPAGGHIAWLAGGNIVNTGTVLTRGLDSGGSMVLAARGDVVNRGTMMNIPVNSELLSAFSGDTRFRSAHGGSLILKAGDDIDNSGFINSPHAFYSMHNVDEGLAWPLFLANTGVGQTMHFEARDDIFNRPAGDIAAEAWTYRHGETGANAPAFGYGGIIFLNSGDRTVNEGRISVTPFSFFGTGGPRFETMPTTRTTTFPGFVSSR